MKKKIAMLITMMVLAVSLAACGDTDTETSGRRGGSDTESSAESERDKKKESSGSSDQKDEPEESKEEPVKDSKEGSAESPSEAPGSDGLDSELFGVWAIDYDMNQVIAAEMGEEFSDFQSSLEMSLCFEFTEEGTFRMFVDEESFKASFDGWMADFEEYLVNYMYDTFKEQGLSPEQADAAIKEAYGSENMASYVHENMAGTLDVDDALEDVETEGTYKVKGDKLYMAEAGDDFDPFTYNPYSVKGDTLEIDTPDTSEEELLPGLEYPLSFHRVQ